MSVLNDSTPEALARMVGIEVDPKYSGFMVTRRWEDINPTSVKRLVTALDAVDTYNSILIDVDTYSGLFVSSKVEPKTKESDAIDIYQTCTKVTAIASDTTLNSLTPIVGREKDIIHPFGEGTGTGRGVVLQYKNISPSSDTYLMALPDTTMITKLQAISSADTGYTHVNRKTNIDANHSLSLSLLFQKKIRIDWSDTVRANPDFIEQRNPDRMQEGEVLRWYGIANGNDTTIKADLTNTSKAPAGYSILSVVQHDNDDGSDDWAQTVIKQSTDTRTDTFALNPFSITSGSRAVRHIEHTHQLTEPAIGSTPSGYNPISSKLNMNNEGVKERNNTVQKLI